MTKSLIPASPKPWLIAAMALATPQIGAAQEDPVVDPAADAAAAPAPENVLEEYDADTSLVTIGDREITLGDMIRARQALTPQLQQFPDNVIFQGMLEEMVRREVFAAAAEQRGLSDNPAVIEELDTARLRILAAAYLAEAIEPKITEETVRARYEQAVAELPEQEEIRARHILVETEEEAIAVKEEVDGGADFAEVAKAKSTGPSGPNGGDLGFFKNGDMVPAFNDVVFQLEPGTISEPVQTDFGWHVIKVEERRAVAPPAFEELAPQITREMAQEFAAAEIEALADTVGLERAEKLPPPSAIREESLLSDGAAAE